PRRAQPEPADSEKSPQASQPYTAECAENCRRDRGEQNWPEEFMARFATFSQNTHHGRMRFRVLIIGFALTAAAWAGIVENVRIALSQNNFAAAESELNSYRNQVGVNG